MKEATKELTLELNLEIQKRREGTFGRALTGALIYYRAKDIQGITRSSVYRQREEIW